MLDQNNVTTKISEVSETVGKKMGFVSALMSTAGTTSSTRFVLIITCGFVLLKAAAFNISSLVIGHGPVPFDLTDVGILGVAFGGKTIQSFAERGDKQ
jgi:hypothetical protein